MNAAIVKSGVIDDAFIILCAHYAFMESGHDKEKIHAIGEEWETIDTNFKNAQSAAVHLNTCFDGSRITTTNALKNCTIMGTDALSTRPTTYRSSRPG